MSSPVQQERDMTGGSQGVQPISEGCPLIRLLVVLLLGFLASCARPGLESTPGPGAVEGVSREAMAVGVISHVEGDAQLQKAGTAEWIRPQEREPILAQDTIRTGEDGKVDILCNDGHMEYIRPNDPGRTGLCPRVTPTAVAKKCRGDDPYSTPLFVVYRGKRIKIPSPEGIIPPEDIPFIVSPAGAMFTTSQPVFGWLPVSNATSYFVSVKGPEGEIWSEAFTATEVPYPSLAQELLPAAIYSLQVQAIIEDDEGKRVLGEDMVNFAVLSEDQISALGATAESIHQAEEDEHQARVLVAELYKQYGLHSHAIAELKPLAKVSSKPIYSVLLGRLYLEAGLPFLADDEYLWAKNQFQESGDKQGEVTALLGLGQSTLALGDFDEGFAKLDEALDLCIAVGDSTGVSSILDMIADIGVRE